MTRDDSRDDWAQQGKQFVSDLRDTVGKKVADNEDTLRGTLGKAARWVDQKTGGKYADSIAKAENTVGEGIGKVAAQGGGPTATGEPQAPGAQSGPGTDADPVTGPVMPPTGGNPPTPAEGVPAPGAAGPATPPPPPQATTPVTPPSAPEQRTGPVTPPPGQATTPLTPPRDDAADWPRPPQ